MEIWKAIADYPNYEVSDLGNVRNVTTGRVLKPGACTSGYLMIKLCKGGVPTNKKIHRLVAASFIPNLENKPCVDHIDGCRSNNCLSNLRWATISENHYNRKPSSKLGFKGIDKNGKKFQARIRINGKYTNLGLYVTPEAAHAAYCAAATEHFGEFARFS